MKIREAALMCVLLFWEIASQHRSTKSLIQKYEHSANTSRILQRDDRRLMSIWADEYQVKRLDLCVKYRVQVLKHEDHIYRSEGNKKWLKCLDVHKREVRHSKRLYHENELGCLRSSTSKDAAKIQDTEMLEREIKKWQKGYRYLVGLCELENPTDKKDADRCLIQYMQSDKYDQLIERLMILKQSAISELYEYYKDSLQHLEHCLNDQLSTYLENIKKWQKGYRYLVGLCDMENPMDKKDADRCLIQYMQSDKYDQLIERLMILKQSAISELYEYYKDSLQHLEHCLNDQLSTYLENVRAVMQLLNKCYKSAE